MKEFESLLERRESFCKAAKVPFDDKELLQACVEYSSWQYIPIAGETYTSKATGELFVVVASFCTLQAGGYALVSLKSQSRFGVGDYFISIRRLLDRYKRVDQ